MSFSNKDFNNKGSILTKPVVKKNGIGAWIIFGIGLMSVIWVFGGFTGIGGKTYKSNISGMSDAKYTQCIKLGSEVMETQDDAFPDNSVTSSSKSNVKKYNNKYDQWNRSCSLQALQRSGVNFKNTSYPPSSPLDWANLV